MFVYVQLLGWQVLQWKKSNRKQEVRASQPKTETLVLVGFANEQLSVLQWENRQEFEWAGSMYDLLKTTVTEDSTYFLCLKDERESLFNECLKELKGLVLGLKEKSDSPDESKGSQIKDLFVVQHACHLAVNLQVISKVIYFYLFIVSDHRTAILGLPPWRSL